MQIRHKACTSQQLLSDAPSDDFSCCGRHNQVELSILILIGPCRHSTESWEAIGALARHVVLKAPDKADYRAVATEASVSLMMQLPIISQHQFVLFAARLAQTPKVTPS